LGKFKAILLKVRTMEKKDTEKKTYEEPTLVKHEKLADITEGGAPVGSNATQIN